MPTIDLRPQLCPQCGGRGARRWLVFELTGGRRLEKPLQFECPHGHLSAGDNTQIAS